MHRAACYAQCSMLCVFLLYTLYTIYTLSLNLNLILNLNLNINLYLNVLKREKGRPSLYSILSIISILYMMERRRPFPFIHFLLCLREKGAGLSLLYILYIIYALNLNLHFNLRLNLNLNLNLKFPENCFRKSPNNFLVF